MDDSICEYCDKPYQLIPIILPCGYKVCKIHLDNQLTNIIDCFICQNHEINIQDCFNMGKNRQIIQKSDSELKKHELNSKLNTLDEILVDPKYLIESNYQEITRKVDLRREELKMSMEKIIDEYSCQLIDQINSDKNETLKELDDLVKQLQIEKENYNSIQIEFLVNKINLLLNSFQNPSSLSIEENYKVDIQKLFGVLNLKPAKKFSEKFQGKCVKTLIGHLSKVNQIKCLEQGRIVSCSGDGSIRVWDTNKEECIKAMFSHTSNIICLEVLSNSLILSGSEDTSIKLWNVLSGELLRTFLGHTKSVLCLKSLDPGTSDRFISGSKDDTIKVWKLESGKVLKTIDWNPNRPIRVDSKKELTFDGVNSILVLDKDNIVSGSKNGLIKVLNIQNGQILAELNGHSSSIEFLSFLNSDNIIISGSNDSEIRVWNLSNNECINKIRVKDFDLRIRYALLGEKEIAICDRKGTLQIWCLDKMKCVRTIKRKIKNELPNKSFFSQMSKIVTNIFFDYCNIFKGENGQIIVSGLGDSFDSHNIEIWH